MFHTLYVSSEKILRFTSTTNSNILVTNSLKESYFYVSADTLSAKLGEEQITEKVYFEKYLKVSECIREFVLNNDSNYYKEFLRNTKRRQANFGLDEESNSEMESCEGEVDYYMSYEEFLNSYHEHDEYEYNSDERYMMDYEYTINNDNGEYDYEYEQL
ncbi:hypothetical protein BpHYR1_024736 [Brachionus plicatilis]|uniref:Uncharacterized protein n=1 Tax=Brachionus plicatilis TaxID=10195 RepID=A0A3M7PA54_BRAPC|nr:hypothetical protein BpHYR1_024736 [Brachionus plicatilis]